MIKGHKEREKFCLWNRGTIQLKWGRMIIKQFWQKRIIKQWGVQWKGKFCFGDVQLTWNTQQKDFVLFCFHNQNGKTIHLLIRREKYFSCHHVLLINWIHIRRRITRTLNVDVWIAEVLSMSALYCVVPFKVKCSVYSIVSYKVKFKVLSGKCRL